MSKTSAATNLLATGQVLTEQIGAVGDAVADARRQVEGMVTQAQERLIGEMTLAQQSLRSLQEVTEGLMGDFARGLCGFEVEVRDIPVAGFLPGPRVIVPTEVRDSEDVGEEVVFAANDATAPEDDGELLGVPAPGKSKKGKKKRKKKDR